MVLRAKRDFSGAVLGGVAGASEASGSNGTERRCSRSAATGNMSTAVLVPASQLVDESASSECTSHSILFRGILCPEFGYAKVQNDTK